MRHKPNEQAQRHRLANVGHAQQQDQPNQGEFPGMQEHKNIFQDLKFESREKAVEPEMAPVIVYKINNVIQINENAHQEAGQGGGG